MRVSRRRAALLVPAVALLLGCASQPATRAASWSVVAFESGERLSIEVLNDCRRVDTVLVSSDEERVSIRPMVVDAPVGDCPDDDGAEIRSVVLDEPVGDRALVGCVAADRDAPCAWTSAG